MDAYPGPLSELQFDVHQRYAYLQQTVAALVRGRPSQKLRVLDVGCGPLPITQWYLADLAVVVRADVEQFGDSEVVLLTPGQALPFDDRSFDIVLAMDVLEHVGADDRTAFLRDCFRVCSQFAVFAYPEGSGLTEGAERRFAQAFRTIFAAENTFLQEHASMGLPRTAAVTEVLERAGAVISRGQNVNLSTWLHANILDALYLREFGDGEEKRVFNRRINAEYAFNYASKPHYRTFVWASRTSEKAVQVQRAIDRLRGPLQAPETAELPLAFVRDILDFVEATRLIKIGHVLQGAVALPDAQADALALALEREQLHSETRAEMAEAFQAASNAWNARARELKDEVDQLRLEIARLNEILVKTAARLEAEQHRFDAEMREQARLNGAALAEALVERETAVKAAVDEAHVRLQHEQQRSGALEADIERLRSQNTVLQRRLTQALSELFERSLDETSQRESQAVIYSLLRSRERQLALRTGQMLALQAGVQEWERRKTRRGWRA